MFKVKLGTVVYSVAQTGLKSAFIWTYFHLWIDMHLLH